MKKNGAFRRVAALMAALSITVSLAAPAFAETYYYIDDGDITITKDEYGKQTVQQGSNAAEKIGDDEEIIITTHKKAITSLESDLEGPAAEDSGFGPVVEDNYQPAQPEDAEEPEGADQPKDAEEPKDADQPENTDRKESAEQSENTDRQESAGQQAQPQQAAPTAAAPAAPTSVNPKDNGFWGNTITVINNFADKVLNLTLKDVKIDVSDTGNSQTQRSGKAALSVQGSGDVEIELDGDNELKSGFNRAGLEKNTSTFTSTGTLTLKDSKGTASGSLKAEGGECGAGIGSRNYKNGENITITGGTVNATGGKYAAGIGGGQNGSGENITITGGTVNATGGKYAAGIGGGQNGSGENITIEGGTVNAVSGQYGAGIGGGQNGSGKNITIKGGTVTATDKDSGAGIGGGYDSSGKNITISGGTVNATGGLYGGAGIGGGHNGSGSNVKVSGDAKVTAVAGGWKSRWNRVGATIGDGDKRTYENGANTYSDGEEIQADISGLITGYIHHIIYEQDGTTIKKEWWEPERTQPKPESPQPNPEDPNAPAEESNEVDLGTPGLHVETLKGAPLPFDARQQGSTLRVTSNTLAARLHGTRQALEALREQGVEQIQFVTSFKTTTLSVAELLAEGGSWFALEHNGLVSRRLSAAQAESLKCRMR